MEISRVRGIGCVIRAEYVAGPLGLVLGDQSTRRIEVLQVVIQALVILPGEHKAKCNSRDWGRAEASHNSRRRP